MDGILSSMGIFGDKKESRQAKPAPAPAIETQSVAHTTPTEDRTTTMKAQPSFPHSSPSPQNNADMGLSLDLSPSAVIGSKINFKGELSGDEDLLIQGKVEGTVTLNGHKLTIGKLGNVKANLQAKNIIIDGTVEGDIIADEHISINASSVVRGNIIAERVTLEDGAKFRGSIDMDTNEKPKSSGKPITPKVEETPAS